MHRARRAGLSALFVLVVLIGAVAPPRSSAEAGPRLLADVSWPPSTLVVSDVQTGGTSASDEFVEVANQGVAPVDLGGLELVYVTASGGIAADVTSRVRECITCNLESRIHAHLTGSLCARVARRFCSLVG